MEEGKKKEGLTLSQLATYDDLITDALIDHVYYWSKIRKNKTRYFASRGLKEEEVTDVLRKHVIYKGDPAAGLQELLKLGGIAKVYDRLSTKHDKEHFRNHLKKYVDIYMPDCPFEVITTNRYNITVQEAAIVSRRFMKRGETVKYLIGIQVPMTKEEEKTLGLNRSDFSVVISRKKQAMLFLGPARFANHDCDANAKLSGTGANGMMVVARKDIDVDDEITVSYGDDYFGIGNCECLCATCEKLLRNGWEPRESKKRKAGEAENLAESVENGERDESSPSKKQKTSPGDLNESKTASPSKLPGKTQQGNKQSKLSATGKSTKVRIPQGLEVPNDIEMQHLSAQDLADMVVNYVALLPLAQGVAELIPAALQQKILIGKESSPVRHEKIAQLQKEASGVDLPTPDDSVDYEASLHGSGSSRASTAVSSIFDTVGPSKSKLPASLSRQPSKNESQAAGVSDKDALQTKSGPPENGESNDSPARATRSRTAAVTNNSNNIKDNVEEIKGDEEGSDSDDSEDDEMPERKPGDWTLTPLLLGTPFSRWVNCRVCEGDFVQQEALQTRWACPRCERHIKLYGFQWPKTERAGPKDDDIRFTDWRTIHPFLYPDEEKDVRKAKNKALDQLKLEKEQEAGSLERDSSEQENTRTRTRTGRGRTRTEAFGKDDEDELEREGSPTKRARIERRRERQNAILEWNKEMISSPKSAKAKAVRVEPKKKAIADQTEKNEENEQGSKYGGVWRKRRKSAPMPTQNATSKKPAKIVPVKKRAHRKLGAAEIAASQKRIERAVAGLQGKSDDAASGEVDDSERESDVLDLGKSLHIVLGAKDTRTGMWAARIARESDAEHGDDNMSDHGNHTGRSASKPPTQPLERRKGKIGRPRKYTGKPPRALPFTTRDSEDSGDGEKHHPLNGYGVRQRQGSNPEQIADSVDLDSGPYSPASLYLGYTDKKTPAFGSQRSPSHTGSVPPSEASAISLEFGEVESEDYESDKDDEAERIEKSRGMLDQLFGNEREEEKTSYPRTTLDDLDMSNSTRRHWQTILGPNVPSPNSFNSSSTHKPDTPDHNDDTTPAESKRTPIKTRKAQNLGFLDRS